MTYFRFSHARTAVMAAVLAASTGAALAAEPTIAVTLGGLDTAGRMADRNAFCPPAGTAEANVSPAVDWSAGPEGTRSYALLMTDPDVPADLATINAPGVAIASTAPRITIHHWVLADIPAATTHLDEGAEGRGVVPHGKPVGPTDHGLRGANVYTGFVAGQPGMAGTYGGYDGPCPPVNDARVHRYTVRVMALDVATLGLAGAFTGAQVEAAVQGHVLAEGTATGTYAVNPAAEDAAP